MDLSVDGGRYRYTHVESDDKIMKELLQSDLSFDKSENVNVDRAEFVDPMIKDSMKKKIQGSAGT